jgi:hypothetical protein
MPRPHLPPGVRSVTTQLAPHLPPIFTGGQAPFPARGVAAQRFGPHQAERWLCAEPLTTVSGTAKTVTLRAKQGCWVDLSRLVIQGFASAVSGTTLAVNPFNQDLNTNTFITQITVTGDQKMIQGQPTSGNTAVNLPAAFFSSCRDITGWHMQGPGSWYRLETQDTIAIDTIQTSGLAGKILAAAPIVLDCDEGMSAYPAGVNLSGGSQAVASTESTDTAIASDITLKMTLNQAGILNWNAMQIGGSYDITAAGTSVGGVTILPYTTSYISSLTDFTSQEYIQGVPDTGGNDLALPLSVYMPAGLYADRAGFPWCRLQAQQGSSGNAISMSINSASFGGGTSAKRALSVGAPFYAAGNPSPLDCK